MINRRRKVKMENVKVEVEGYWTWVYGETYPVKEELKAQGFRWSPKRRGWYRKSIVEVKLNGNGIKATQHIKEDAQQTKTPIEMVSIRVLEKLPVFMGIDGKIYKLEPGVIDLPKENAEVLIKRGVATRKEAKELNGGEPNGGEKRNTREKIPLGKSEHGDLPNRKIGGGWKPKEKKELTTKPAIEELMQEKREKSAVERKKKEPWEMTREEFLDYQEKYLLERAKKTSPKTAELSALLITTAKIRERDPETVRFQIEEIRKGIVEKALKEGKPVPDAVLKDYPDLMEKYGDDIMRELLFRYGAEAVKRDLEGFRNWIEKEIKICNDTYMLENAHLLERLKEDIGVQKFWREAHKKELSERDRALIEGNYKIAKNEEKETKINEHEPTPPEESNEHKEEINERKGYESVGEIDSIVMKDVAQFVNRIEPDKMFELEVEKKGWRVYFANFAHTLAGIVEVNQDAWIRYWDTNDMELTFDARRVKNMFAAARKGEIAEIEVGKEQMVVNWNWGLTWTHKFGNKEDFKIKPHITSLHDRDGYYGDVKLRLGKEAIKELKKGLAVAKKELKDWVSWDDREGIILLCAEQSGDYIFKAYIFKSIYQGGGKYTQKVLPITSSYDLHLDGGSKCAGIYPLSDFERMLKGAVKSESLTLSFGDGKLLRSEFDMRKGVHVITWQVPLEFFDEEEKAELIRHCTGSKDDR